MLRPTLLATGLIALAFAAPAARAQNPMVVLDTNMGPITIELFADKAPATVANFLKYVDSKHYDGTVFHRVIGPNPRQPEGFMIQGGGFENANPLRQKDSGDPILNEASNGLKNERGTLAMARTSDPNSASDQFFVNLADNKFLNLGDPDAVDEFGYAVFGKVVEGMEVVDKIAKVDTGRAGVMAKDRTGRLSRTTFGDVPNQPVVIKSATLKAK
jgi:cyclophilin family peptidyl-prolyl cis-trans isomerase